MEYQVWVSGRWISFTAATKDEAWDKAFAICRETKIAEGTNAR